MTIEGRAHIGIVSSDPLRRLGLTSILEDTLGVQATPLEMEEVFTTEGLAAVVLDSRATEDALLEMIAGLRRERPVLKVVVMGESLEPSHVQAVIGAGAKGYLAERAGESEIRMAIEVVLDGSIWAPRKVLARLIDASGTSSGSPGGDEPVQSKLTPRELEVLHLLKAGCSNRDIAEAMNIDEVTVKAHLGRMLRKTGASNRVELTLRALEEENADGRRLR
jgi:DNA-binding NarL/FixJ family response regulator